jgi:MFS family permease
VENIWLILDLVLLVAVPMGKLGDRYGRRKIMALTLFGIACALSEVFIVCEYYDNSI